MRVNSHLGEVRRRGLEGAAIGLNRVAAQVQSETVPRTPLLYGDLRDSIEVSPATADDLRATVGSELPYAVKQHEDLTYTHRDGEAKYLEKGSAAVEGMAGQIIATAIRQRLGA